MVKSMRWSLFFILILGFLQYKLWFQPDGILDMLQLKKQLLLQNQKNAQLKKHNVILISQIQKLQGNKEAIETRARDELGMIKKDETFYQVVR